ncbi:MAG: hypothetical protein AAF490_23870 [Chloroflexota bacterium]
MKKLFLILKSNHKLLWGFVIFALVGVGCQNPSPNGPNEAATPTPIQMQVFESDAPITLLYPVDWQFMLPRQGILIFGEEQTLFKSQPGAVFTVLRVPNHQVHGDLEGEFNHYLDFGPRRDNYQEIEEVAEITIGERKALTVRMNFPGDDERLPFETNITAVETESGAVYILSETAPSDVWEEHQASFSAILGSISFKE